MVAFRLVLRLLATYLGNALSTLAALTGRFAWGRAAELRAAKYCAVPALNPTMTTEPAHQGIAVQQ